MCRVCSPWFTNPVVGANGSMLGVVPRVPLGSAANQAGLPVTMDKRHGLAMGNGLAKVLVIRLRCQPLIATLRRRSNEWLAVVFAGEMRWIELVVSPFDGPYRTNRNPYRVIRTGSMYISSLLFVFESPIHLFRL